MMFCVTDERKPNREPSWISARCLLSTKILGLARILVLPTVSSARMNPVMLLEIKPYLMPLVDEAKPLGSGIVLDAILPAAVSTEAGVKPTLLLITAPAPIVPSC